MRVRYILLVAVGITLFIRLWIGWGLLPAAIIAPATLALGLGIGLVVLNHRKRTR
jgi:hypothetical protein